MAQATIEPDIRIGTLVNRGMDSADYISRILPHGFECFSLMFWQSCEDINFRKLPKGVKPVPPFAFHRTPGYGDSNWTEIISERRRGGYRGAIDIEGWHDPVMRGELEMSGQVRALNYLKTCRGDFVPNPA